MGSTMIARTMPMKKIVPPEMPVVAKSGNQPSASSSNVLHGLRHRAEDDEAPEAVDDRGHRGEQVDERGGRPRAARRGAYCVMNSATPTPTRHRDDHRDGRGGHGRPEHLEDAEARAGRRRATRLGEVRKFAVLSSSAGTAWTTRKAPIRVTMPMTRMPAPWPAPPKSRSPRRPVDAPSPCSGPRPSGPGSLVRRRTRR